MSRSMQVYRDATLFIVDDDDIDAMTIERSFRKMKLLNPVLRAKDGQQALDMLAADQVPAPYIILLDLNMPRMGGLEFLARVRKDPKLTSVVIFVLTTSKSDEDLAAAYQDHVAGYVLKQQIGNNFIDLISLIECYWRVVELPIPASGQSE